MKTTKKLPAYEFIARQYSYQTGELEERTVKTFEHNEAGLDDLLGAFEAFLKGAGFSFEGNLAIVEDEDAADEGKVTVTPSQIDEIVDAYINDASGQSIRYFLKKRLFGDKGAADER